MLRSMLVLRPAGLFEYYKILGLGAEFAETIEDRNAEFRIVVNRWYRLDQE